MVKGGAHTTGATKQEKNKVLQTSCVSMEGIEESHDDEKLYDQVFQSIFPFLKQEIMWRLIVPSKLIFKKAHSKSAVMEAVLSLWLGYTCLLSSVQRGKALPPGS